MNAEAGISQAFIRQYNIQRVVSMLETCQTLTRTDIARIADISPASVTRIVGALNALGLIEEVSSAATGPGRKAVEIRPKAGGLYTVGFHIGVNALYMCVMDFTKMARTYTFEPMNSEGITPESVAALAGRMLKQLEAGAQPYADRIQEIGVTVSGQVDANSGNVIRSEVFNWSQVALGKIFESVVGLPTRVENDVKGCLTWEKKHRNVPDAQDMAYLYIGHSGIGFANMVAGSIVRGRDNSTGEIESTHFMANDSLENHLMSREIMRRAKAVSPGVKSLSDILTARKMGLTWAITLTDDFLWYLHTIFTAIQALLDPHLIILGGDVPLAFQDLPGLLPDEHYILGDRFEESCAMGAAMIAMHDAVERRISNLLENRSGGV